MSQLNFSYLKKIPHLPCTIYILSIWVIFKKNTQHSVFIYKTFVCNIVIRSIYTEAFLLKLFPFFKIFQHRENFPSPLSV